jgi:hypothetical protein
VPEECVSEAVELLADLHLPATAIPSVPLPLRDRMRIVLEGLLFGWFVPGSRKRKRGSPDDLTPNTSLERTRDK